MKNINKLILGMAAIAAVSVSVSAIAAAQNAPGSPESAAIQQQIDMQRYFPELVTAVPQEHVGAVSSLSNVDSPYVNINGSNFYYYNQAITASSSLPCSLKNPFGATSTVEWYSMGVQNNGLGAQNIEVATSSSNYGTSTPAFVYQFKAPAGVFAINWTANGTTTNARVIGMTVGVTGTSDVILNAGEYLNAKIATSSPGAFSSYYSGYCKALIRQF